MSDVTVSSLFTYLSAFVCCYLFFLSLAYVLNCPYPCTPLLGKDAYFAFFILSSPTTAGKFLPSKWPLMQHDSTLIQALLAPADAV
jgi:hypothetical protein